jgi:hypothetical protein
VQWVGRNKEDFTDSVPQNTFWNQDLVHQVIFSQAESNAFSFLPKRDNASMRACSSSLKAELRPYFWTEIEKFFKEQNNYWTDYNKPYEDVKAIYEALNKLETRYSFDDSSIFKFAEVSTFTHTTPTFNHHLVKSSYQKINQKIANREYVCIDCDSSDSLLNLENIRRIKRLIDECDVLGNYDHQSNKRYLTGFLSILLWMRGEYLPYHKELPDHAQSICKIM